MIGDGEQTYTQRVYQAYAELAAERQTPDVPVHELYGLAGGSLAELDDWLRQECFAHHCVPTTGEPAFASDEAKRTALTLPGESGAFLNIKLLDLPPMTQEQPPQAKPQPKITLTLNANQAHLVAEALYYGVGELEQYANGHGRDIDGVYTHCDYLYDLERGPLAFAQNSREDAGELRQDQPAELPDQAIAKRYERLLRQTAALRYPRAEKTPELQQRIDATISRKVSEFCQERELKQYEASLRRTLAERYPNLTAEQKREYDQRIAELVNEQRQARQTHPQSTRSQQQGRGMDIER